MPVFSDMLFAQYAVTWAVNSLLLNLALNPANAIAGSIAAWGLTLKGCTDTAFGIATFILVKAEKTRNYAFLALKTSSKIVRGIGNILSGPNSIIKSWELALAQGGENHYNV